MHVLLSKTLVFNIIKKSVSVQIRLETIDQHESEKAMKEKWNAQMTIATKAISFNLLSFKDLR